MSNTAVIEQKPTIIKVKASARSETSILRNFPIILMAITYGVFFVIDDFSIGATVFVVVMSLALLVHALFHLDELSRFKPSKMMWCFFFIILLVLINIRDFDYLSRHPFYIFTMVYSLLAIPFIKINLRTIKALFVILLIPGLIASFAIILNRFSPSTYTSLILSRLSASSVNEYYFLTKQGYGAILGANIGLTGSYLTTGIILSFSYLLIDKGKHRFLMFIYLAILVLSLVLLNRRGEPLGVLAACYIMILVKSKKRIPIFIVTLLLVLIAAFVIISIPPDAFDTSNRLFSILKSLQEGIDITNGRGELYGIAANLFIESPLFGIGWGGFTQYGSQVIGIVNNVHNIYLQLFTEIGVIGVIVLIVLLTVIIKKAYRGRPTLTKYSLTAYGTIAFVLVFGLFDNPIFQDYFFVYFIPILLFLSLGRKPKWSTL